eukprot:PLAT7960.2.p1 GENE.PLAT7960.2~~PLAT7960.2.p1  ORF type:complete len:329 (+),score=170.98 PLAT7960.2:396-1382(+)
MPSRPLVVSAKVHSFVYLDHGAFTLVAHISEDEGVEMVVAQLKELRHLLQFFFGPCDRWSSDSIILDGMSDLIDHLFEKYRTQLASLSGGVQWVSLSLTERDQLDLLLASLEENESILGSMLILGSSVLHSRLPPRDAALILHYACARPLGHLKLRSTPVYSDGTWKHLLFARLGVYTLALASSIRMRMPDVLPAVRSFESALHESALVLPVEAPPVLLRHFTGYDTVCFVYRHVRTGVTIAPQPRPGPVSEMKRTINTFLWFFSRARELAGRSSVTEIVLRKDGYKFHVQLDEVHELYVLYSDHVKAEDIDRYSQEIITNAYRKVHE